LEEAQVPETFAAGRAVVGLVVVEEAHIPQVYIAVVEVAVVRTDLGRIVFDLAVAMQLVVAHIDSERTVFVLVVAIWVAIVAHIDFGRSVFELVEGTSVAEDGCIGSVRIAFVSGALTSVENCHDTSMYRGCSYLEAAMWRFERCRILALIAGSNKTSCARDCSLDGKTEAGWVALERLAPDIDR